MGYNSKFSFTGTKYLRPTLERRVFDCLMVLEVLVHNHLASGQDHHVEGVAEESCSLPGSWKQEIEPGNSTREELAKAQI